jgi:sterol desaturase/sphingolipid hydroxylase (fatty acid hydroxylase superfamily)
MPLSDRLRIALLSIPAASLERAFWYVTIAGLAWLTLHVLFARWLAHRRIADRSPTLGQMSREILYSIRSLAIYGLVGGFVVFAYFSGWTQIYTRIAPGHASSGPQLFQLGPLSPGWTYLLLTIGLIILIHDAYFYWTHRLMHHPRLFRLMHRTHHLSINPSPWAAYAFSPWEAFVQAGIAPLVLFTLPTHPLAFSVFMLWQISFNVLGHCGYELFPRWFVRSPLGRLFNTATHHAQHHETNRSNFSLYFNLWDRLLGTNHHSYAQRFAKAVSEMSPSK